MAVLPKATCCAMVSRRIVLPWSTDVLRGRLFTPVNGYRPSGVNTASGTVPAGLCGLTYFSKASSTYLSDGIGTPLPPKIKPVFWATASAEATGPASTAVVGAAGAAAALAALGRADASSANSSCASTGATGSVSSDWSATSASATSESATSES